MPYMRGRINAVFTAVVALWLVIAVDGSVAAQSRLPGNLGEPVDFGGGYSDSNDTYLGGLKELLRHDPNLSETEKPLSLRDLDRNEAPPLIISSGRASPSRTNTTGSGSDNSSQKSAVASNLVTSYFGAAGLVDDADSLLIFSRSDAPSSSVRRESDGRSVDGYSSRPQSIYEFGLISSTAPTFEGTRATPLSESIGGLKVADLGISNPALQARLSIPDFGGNFVGSGRAIGTQRGKLSAATNIGSGQASQKLSIVAWVKATVSQAATQPLFYVVVVCVLLILGLLGARRSP